MSAALLVQGDASVMAVRRLVADRVVYAGARDRGVAAAPRHVVVEEIAVAYVPETRQRNLNGVQLSATSV